MQANLNNFTATILALQAAAFGWRINREIAVGDKGADGARGEAWTTYLPAIDKANLVSMAAVLVFCVCIPAITESFGSAARSVLVGAALLLVFHPAVMVAHYEILRGGRRKLYAERKSWPQSTAPERWLTGAAIVVALIGAGIAFYGFEAKRAAPDKRAHLAATPPNRAATRRSSRSTASGHRARLVSVTQPDGASLARISSCSPRQTSAAACGGAPLRT